MQEKVVKEIFPSKNILSNCAVATPIGENCQLETSNLSTSLEFNQHVNTGSRIWTNWKKNFAYPD